LPISAQIDIPQAPLAGGICFFLSICAQNTCAQASRAEKLPAQLCYHIHCERLRNQIRGIFLSARRKIILGIESSCDETAAAVVSGGDTILSSIVASQIAIHRKYGGVVPELASREHLRQIVPVVREALEQAGMTMQDLDAVAVTRGPGLVGALLVGITYGKVLAQALGKPLIGVNHLEGHVHAVFLEAHAAKLSPPELPAACLIVSGGHTVIYFVKSDQGGCDSSGAARARSVGCRSFSSDIKPDSSSGALAPEAPVGAAHFYYERLGGTRDDAAGEAYDKVARLLALGYPGGPVMDRLAQYGNPRAIRFAEPKMKGNAHDFSFSGIKTAVLYHLKRHPELQPEIDARREALARGERSADALRKLSSEATLDVIASFQRAVVDDLVTRTIAAAQQNNVRSILVSGGVAANRELRASFEAESKRHNLAVYFPSRALSTDNAAMIAAAGYPRLVAGQHEGATLNAEPNLSLA
jgi:N6-L-threonylcarbamoyladenine synthase